MTSIIKVDQIQNAAGGAVMSFDGNGDVTFNGANTVTPVDSGWIEATLNSGFTHYASEYGPVRYRKIGNIVTIQGLVNEYTGGTIFTLPVGFRPLETIVLTQINQNAFARMDIRASGDVKQQSGVSGWFSLACTFFTA